MPIEFQRRTVGGTRVQAADIEEVFIGKLHGRLRFGRLRFGRRRDGLVPIRDLYDMAVCMGEQPEPLAHHFRQLTDEQIRVYGERLRRVPSNWHERDEDRIIEPTYAVDLRGIAQKVAYAVECRDAHRIPIARPMNSPPPVQHTNSGSDTMQTGP